MPEPFHLARSEFLRQGLTPLSEKNRNSVHNAGPSCFICLEPYRTFIGAPNIMTPGYGITLHENEDPVVSPCNHVFGKQCIIQWAMSHHTCPICRREFYPDPAIFPQALREITQTIEVDLTHPFWQNEKFILYIGQTLYIVEGTQEYTQWVTGAISVGCDPIDAFLKAVECIEMLRWVAGGIMNAGRWLCL